MGEILDYRDGKAFIEVKNRFSVGDSIEVILPNEACFDMRVESMHTDKGEELDVAKGSGYQVWIPMAKEIKPELGFIARNFDEKIKIKNKNVKKDPNQKIRRPSW